ncbi:hypothetical protein HaLaN_17735, partial [Haematococcus lacustris]
GRALASLALAAQELGGSQAAAKLLVVLAVNEDQLEAAQQRAADHANQEERIQMGPRQPAVEAGHQPPGSDCRHWSSRPAAELGALCRDHQCRWRAHPPGGHRPGPDG